MSKITVIQVVYNNKPWIERVFSSIFAQTFQDFEVVAIISGNEDGSKQLLEAKFPQVKIIDPDYNIGFAKGHNLVFREFDSEFYQLVNPDLILEPNYLEEMLKVFQDEKVGAATGKLYKITETGIMSARGGSSLGGNYELWKKENVSKIIDTTGVTISKSGRARDRGQYEIDMGQYDTLKNLQAVSAAGAMYRKTALENVKMSKKLNSTPLALSPDDFEYFDEDFHSYWEDVDLAWRMTNAAWKCVFQPLAIGYHGRGAASSPGGYKKVFSFIFHHRKLPERIRILNFKNHIFMYIKNSKWLYPEFFFREFFMAMYILFFEQTTLKVLPEFFRILPRMWKKRKLIVK